MEFMENLEGASAHAAGVCRHLYMTSFLLKCWIDEGNEKQTSYSEATVSG